MEEMNNKENDGGMKRTKGKDYREEKDEMERKEKEYEEILTYLRFGIIPDYIFSAQRSNWIH
jgi:hypothetical protein